MFGRKKKNPYDIYVNYDDGNGSLAGNLDSVNDPVYSGMKQKKVSFNLVLLICSVLASVGFWMIGEYIYHSFFADDKSMILVIGGYYLLFGIVLMIGLFVAYVITWNKITNLKIAYVAISLVFLLVGGALFELLYEMGSNEKRAHTDVIFAIDNSGSMSSTDPEFVRIDAMNEIVAGQNPDFQYAVYTFGGEIKMLREMGPVTETIEELDVLVDGGTPIVSTLETIQDDIEKGNLKIRSNAKIVLLTDGYATDNGFIFHTAINKPLKYFADMEIAINTVGLGDVDKNLLTKMADATDGVFVMVDEVSQLKEAMKTATNASLSRNLLAYRRSFRRGWFFAILRIIAITLLGLFFIPIKVSLGGNTESEEMILILSIAGSVLAGILMELMINLVNFSPSFVHLICCILIGLTPAYKVKYYDFYLDFACESEAW